MFIKESSGKFLISILAVILKEWSSDEPSIRIIFQHYSLILTLGPNPLLCCALMSNCIPCYSKPGHFGLSEMYQPRCNTGSSGIFHPMCLLNSPGWARHFVLKQQPFFLSSWQSHDVLWRSEVWKENGLSSGGGWSPQPTQVQTAWQRHRSAQLSR